MQRTSLTSAETPSTPSSSSSSSSVGPPGLGRTTPEKAHARETTANAVADSDAVVAPDSAARRGPRDRIRRLGVQFRNLPRLVGARDDDESSTEAVDASQLEIEEIRSATPVTGSPGSGHVARGMRKTHWSGVAKRVKRARAVTRAKTHFGNVPFNEKVHLVEAHGTLSHSLHILLISLGCEDMGWFDSMALTESELRESEETCGFLDVVAKHSVGFFGSSLPKIWISTRTIIVDNITNRCKSTVNGKQQGAGFSLIPNIRTLLPKSWLFACAFSNSWKGGK